MGCGKAGVTLKGSLVVAVVFACFLTGDDMARGQPTPVPPPVAVAPATHSRLPPPRVRVRERKPMRPTQTGRKPVSPSRKVSLGDSLNSRLPDITPRCRARLHLYPDVGAVQGPDYLFVPMHKAGSTYVTQVLKEHFGAHTCQRPNGEVPLRPGDRRGRKMIFSSTRNPFEMYVSLWAYGLNGKGNMFDVLTLRNLDYGEDNPGSFQKWARLVLNPGISETEAPGGTTLKPSRARRLGSGLDFQKMLEWDIGLITQRHIELTELSNYEGALNHPHNNMSVDHHLRCCDDLDGEIRKAMSMVDLQCRQNGFNGSEHGCTSPRYNPSTHLLRWRDYYGDDAELLCLVQYKDRWVMEKFGYDPIVKPSECGELGYRNNTGYTFTNYNFNDAMGQHRQGPEDAGVVLSTKESPPAQSQPRKRHIRPGLNRHRISVRIGRTG